ncbi:MAG: YigZ family protein [Oscillospiraceae bacterium]|nr:YigZ family protein [Oscillospiraceae bacterium]
MYIVPYSYGESEYVEKHSRFIARVWPVKSEKEALEHLREVREKHWDATHNVYAYSIKEGNIARFSDDGEPSGTSGMPVLNVFTSGGVNDFICVVTRYFGGILLGAGGLVRAYSKAASMALDEAGRAEMKVVCAAALKCSYAQLERIKAETARFHIAVDSIDYGAGITMTLSVPQEELETYIARITDITAGSVAPVKTGECLKPVKL